ncbi:hypothetical protein L596_024713 [Steinernema carpocapsae]|uniref:Uncharacterized protein n=1 Tax=Steinernema carpocapsae TaxID=34508 RepID=A0A4U5M5K7_STECR|nr:hypothetical protein L596_024713 [Steinernema carpocapsae]
MRNILQQEVSKSAKMVMVPTSGSIDTGKQVGNPNYADKETRYARFGEITGGDLVPLTRAAIFRVFLGLTRKKENCLVEFG